MVIDSNTPPSCYHTSVKRIIYGTTNPAKIAQVRDVLEPLGFTVKSLADSHSRIAVEEDGKTAEENALKKAAAYAKELGEPVLSMDVGLYFNALPDSEQPGLHVRRIKGNRRPSDQELLDHYTTLIASMGDELQGYWRYAFALAWPNGKAVSFTRDSPRTFVNKPSVRIVKGYPLESLQIDPGSGKYIPEMTSEELAEFWRSSIGAPLTSFVQEHYL